MLYLCTIILYFQLISRGARPIFVFHPFIAVFIIIACTYRFSQKQLKTSLNTVLFIQPGMCTGKLCNQRSDYDYNLKLLCRYYVATKLANNRICIIYMSIKLRVFGQNIQILSLNENTS